MLFPGSLPDHCTRLFLHRQISAMSRLLVICIHVFLHESRVCWNLNIKWLLQLHPTGDALSCADGAKFVKKDVDLMAFDKVRSFEVLVKNQWTASLLVKCNVLKSGVSVHIIHGYLRHLYLNFEMNRGPEYLPEERVSSPKDLFFDWNQNVKERPFLESQPTKLQPAFSAHLFYELHIWVLASRQSQQVEIAIIITESWLINSPQSDGTLPQQPTPFYFWRWLVSQIEWNDTLCCL
jgi:hypothetical protein